MVVEMTVLGAADFSDTADHPYWEDFSDTTDHTSY